jgi:TonB family protein
MFAEPKSPERKRWNRSLFVSFGIHVAVLLLLLHRPAPVFVTVSDVDHGIPRSSGSVSIAYQALVGPEQPKSRPEEPPATQRPSLAHQPMPTGTRPTPAQAKQPTPPAGPEQTARGGSPWGRVPGSPISGDEIVPALPEVFPDPPVSRDDLPAGVQGDVIVEVTIDAQGNVVETKLLQGIGYGIEQKVLAVLQRWHFRPAMRNGVAIASQHIALFHYPG